jgi:hypothetical protein
MVIAIRIRMSASQSDEEQAFDHNVVSLASFIRSTRGAYVTMKSRLIGAVAISLALATPAFAMHRDYHHRYRYVHTALPASTLRAYGYYPRDDFAPENYNSDFDRRNTFN